MERETFCAPRRRRLFHGQLRCGNSVIALDPATGKLKWHYQFTPHDVWDWDAHEPLVEVNAPWEGKPRKLLLQANRNGFFYVLDRTDGKGLLAKPFVKKLTWAREIAANGRPVRNANQEPSDKGTKVCPAVLGATNWRPAAFDASSGLYYIQTIESCGIYKKGPVEWEVGRGSMGGSSRSAPTDPPERSSAPLISTPGKSMFDNKQFVALASGPNILAFGLND